MVTICLSYTIRNMCYFLKSLCFVYLRAITDLNSSISGTNLVKKAIYAMVEGDCDEVRYIDPFPLKDVSINSQVFSRSYFNTSREYLSLREKPETHSWVRANMRGLYA